MRTKTIILAIIVAVLSAMSKGSGNPGTEVRAQYSMQRVLEKGLEVMERDRRPERCYKENWYKNKCLDRCELCSDCKKVCKKCCKEWCKEAPGRPKNVKIRNIGNETYRVSWKLEHNGNSRIKNFFVEYRDKSDGNIATRVRTGRRKRIDLQKLFPGTTYQFVVYAKNQLGTSPPSEAINITTNEQGVRMYDVMVNSAEQYVRIYQMNNGAVVKEEDNTRAPCPDEWDTEDTGCYREFPEATRIEAEEMCMKEGGYVVNITSPKEHGILLSSYGNGPFWSGATKYETEGCAVYLANEGENVYETVNASCSKKHPVVCKKIDEDPSCETRGGRNSICKYLKCGVLFGFCDYWIDYCCCTYHGVKCPILCNTGRPCPGTSLPTEP